MNLRIMLCDTIWWNYLFSSLVTSFRIMRIPDENVFKMKSQLHNKSKDYIQNVFIPNDHNVVSVDISLYLLVFISFPFLYSFILDSIYQIFNSMTSPFRLSRDGARYRRSLPLGQLWAQVLRGWRHFGKVLHYPYGWAEFRCSISYFTPVSAIVSSNN